MQDAFQAVKITDRVWWVGAIDWDVRNFHGYLTSAGTTYNAFLILGSEKTVLVDTVKGPFYDEMMRRIRSVCDPSQIDVILSNHAEMDHSGGLPQAIQQLAPEAVYASANGCKALENHFGLGESVQAVKDGECLELGDIRLSFAETRMCHWPDSMVSYLHDDELLFSQDAFGMHLASYERFADEIDAGRLHHEAAKYYANILLHLSRFVRKSMDKLNGLGLPIRIVAPDHGPIYRREQDIVEVLRWYDGWAEQRKIAKAVVLYDTMWQSTAKMARAIGEGLAAGGATPKLMNMTVSHRSDAATELLDAGAMVVGSPTLNNNIFPTLADTMVYLKGLKPQNLLGAAFGSYGWSGESPKHLDALLEEMNVRRVAEPLSVQYVPAEDDLARCRELGVRVAEALKEMLAPAAG
jgi:flavorubredoxin